jgi:hypothetical protein
VSPAGIFSAAVQPTSYTAPEEFMDLFFDFTGSNEPDYPAGQPIG